MDYLDLKVVATGIESATNNALTTQFFGSGGVIQYNNPGEGSYYIANNDPAKGGRIMIDPVGVLAMVKIAGSDLVATRDLIIHELGHFKNAANEAATFNPNAPAADKIAYCSLREANASMYAFQVVSELKAQGIDGHVVGVTGAPDLYNTLANLPPGTDPIKLTQYLFANDPSYAKYCAENYGSAPKYFAPEVETPIIQDPVGDPEDTEIVLSPDSPVLTDPNRNVWEPDFPISNPGSGGGSGGGEGGGGGGAPGGGGPGGGGPRGPAPIDDPQAQPTPEEIALEALLAGLLDTSGATAVAEPVPAETPAGYLEAQLVGVQQSPIVDLIM